MKNITTAKHYSEFILKKAKAGEWRVKSVDSQPEERIPSEHLVCFSRRGPPLALAANDVYFALYTKAVPTDRAANKLIKWTNY